MATPKKLDLDDWNKIVEPYHSESDRGAAILAGSFAEHALGQYLNSRIRDKKIAELLFTPLGPLSSFSQRITIAYAFDLISEGQYNDFDLIRRIRNHFAHYPLDTTFSTNEIQQLACKLSGFNMITDEEYPKAGARHRIGYLLTCGILSGTLLHTLSIQSFKGKANKTGMTGIDTK